MMERKLTRGAMAAGAALAVLLLWCTTEGPTEADDAPGPVALSVGQQGVTRATYIGMPLKMIVVLRDSVRYSPDVVSFEKGEATFLLPDIEEGTWVRKLEFPFFWTVLPRNGPDSSGIYWDTISAQVGLDKSNVVKVFVKNLPPEITSLVVGDSSVAVSRHLYGDHAYRFQIDSVMNSDSTNVLLMELKVRDGNAQDANRLVATWQPQVYDDLIYVETGPPTRGLKATYYVPETNFADTIQVTLQDPHTHVVLAIILFQTGGKGPTHIDSIVVMDSTFVGAVDRYTYRLVALDTVPTVVRLYSTVKGLSARWTAARGLIQAVADSRTRFAASYRCTVSTCRDTLKTDQSAGLDTISVTLTNNTGESTTKRIVLMKIPANQRPVIDSVRIGSTTLLAQEGRPFIHKAAVGDTLVCRGFFHDAEDAIGDLVVEWSAAKAGRIVAKELETATYVCADTAYVDTLTFRVDDRLKFRATKQLVLTVTHRPTIDSVRVGSAVYTDLAAGVVHRASLGDTLLITSYAHPPKPGEIVTDFTTTSGTRMQSVGLTSVRYYALTDARYRDTVSIRVKDVTGVSTTRAVVLDIANHRPVIDSIIVDGTRFVATSQPVPVQRTVLDSVQIRVYARDPDSTALTDNWTIANASHTGQITRLGAFRIVYACLGSMYTDTIRVTAVDAFGAPTGAAIVVIVDNRRPVIDSIVVGDSTLRWSASSSAEPTYRAMADSSVKFTGFATDPDIGEVLTATYRFVNTDRSRTVALGTGYTYVALDSTYSDTAIVTVRDKRGAADLQRVILLIEKK